jgi:outer membrane cobalamin receptor
LKTAIFYTALLFTASLQAQDQFRSDTILIREVLISAKENGRPSAGFRALVLDSAILSEYNHRTIADLLSERTSLFVKSYGSGGIATPSFRGTGPGHTRIVWNEININNPMLGQFDLSLVPAGLADEVEVSYGGGSMDISGGGFGGIINLETKPDWKKEDVLFINPGLGSFGRFSGLVKVKTGNQGFQSVTRGFLSNAENNFPFVNSLTGTEPVIERRKNSQVSQRGFIQELYFKGSEGIFSTRFWYQETSRNLPVPLTMFSANPGEKQNDRSVRSLVSYESLNKKANFNIAGAFISDKLNYTNRLVSIDSRNYAHSFIFKTAIMTEIGPTTSLKISLDNELNFINSNNYTGKRDRNTASLGISSETSLAQWLVTRWLIRETLHDTEFLVPDFSAGAEIKPFSEKDYFLRANFSKNSKVPTLNDMYWSPGGNPELKNENGYTAEIGLEAAVPVSSSININGSVTAFRNFITDMIQWLPGDNSYWVADNVGKILTSGIESQISFVYSQSRFKALLNVLYSYTKASPERSGEGYEYPGDRQLIYIPENQFSSTVRINWRSLYTSFITNCISRRYLTADNSSYLPGYAVSDFSFGGRINSKKTTYELSIIVDNMFNVSYQNIAWYPMPGRSYLLSVIFQIKS